MFLYASPGSGQPVPAISFLDPEESNDSSNFITKLKNLIEIIAINCFTS